MVRRAARLRRKRRMRSSSQQPMPASAAIPTGRSPAKPVSVKAAAATMNIQRVITYR